MKVKRALVSVYDKAGLDKFVKGLDKLGIEILSTGGTAKFIKDIGLKVTDVSAYTGFPEIMDGRVKTLHPKIHGALLALRDKGEHVRQAKKHGIELIDMVVVNLYPFAEVVSKKGVALEEAIELNTPYMIKVAVQRDEYPVMVAPRKTDVSVQRFAASQIAMDREVLSFIAIDNRLETWL